MTGRKRHIAVDTLGLLICVFAGSANAARSVSHWATSAVALADDVRGTR